MRRVVAFFEWQRDWWLRHGISSARSNEADRSILAQSSDYLEARIAYAKRQAGIRATLAERCTEAWKGTELYLTLGEQL